MEVAKYQPNSRTNLPQFSTEVIQANNWQCLIESSKFDAEKAFLSLQATKMETLAALPHQSIEDVDRMPTASLATIKKYSGEVKMVACVSTLIVQAASLLNIGKAMNEFQVKETARLIFTEYYFLTIGDLKVCLKNGIMGMYGQIFDRMDVAVICGWLNLYANERAAYFAEKERNKSKQQPFQPSAAAIEMPSYIKEKFEAIEMRNKQVRELKDERPKAFATLAAFIDSIGATQKKEALLEVWKNDYAGLKEKVLELDAFLIYKSNRLLSAINSGKVHTWGDALEY